MKIKLEQLGQSGMLLKLEELNILVDPYLSNSVEELDSPDLKRQIKIPYYPEDLINIDLVLITHDHIDHCDPFTIPQLAKASKNAKFMGPEPVRKKLEEWGIDKKRIVPAPISYISINDKVLIRSVPAAHPKLTLGKDKMPIALGWLMKMNNKVIYIAGDTSLCEELIKFLKCLDQIDIAFLPVNEDNYFRRRRGIIGNMTIREAFGLAKEVGIKTVIPVHWDLFRVNGALPEEIKAIYNGYEWPFKLSMELQEI